MNSNGFDYGYIFGGRVYGVGASIAVDALSSQAISCDSVGVFVGFATVLNWDAGHIEGIANDDTTAIGFWAINNGGGSITKSNFQLNDIGVQIGEAGGAVANSGNLSIYDNTQILNSKRYGIRVHANANTHNTRIQNNAFSKWPSATVPVTSLFLDDSAYDDFIVTDNRFITADTDINYPARIDVLREQNEFNLIVIASPALPNTVTQLAAAALPPTLYALIIRLPLETKVCPL